MINLRPLLYLLFSSFIFSNTGSKFHKINEEEKTKYRNSYNYFHKENENNMSNLFHYTTKYKFYDYSGLNQFEQRRKEQENTKLLSDSKYYSNFIINRYS